MDDPKFAAVFHPDPLRGDPTAPDVAHLFDLVHGVTRPARPAPRPIPLIHEACQPGGCGGCSSHGCVTRTTLSPPAQAPTAAPPATQARWYDGDDQTDGNNS